MITVEPTLDMGLVKDIMSEDEIWECAAEDGLQADDFYPVYNDTSAWLLFKENDKICGIMLVHNDTSVSVKIHFYAKKKYKKRAVNMMDAFYKFIINIEQVQKITAQIPACFMKTINFARKVGFAIEGVNKLSYMKNNELVDQFMLGVTREEIKERLA